MVMVVDMEEVGRVCGGGVCFVGASGRDRQETLTWGLTVNVTPAISSCQTQQALDPPMKLEDSSS